MTWTMQPNGTVSSWKTADGTHVLFPESELKFGKEKKLRGGAPVCIPNFGTAPTDGPYQGIRLPKHGLVRLCNTVNGDDSDGYPAVHQTGPQLAEHGWTNCFYKFCYPWAFDVNISAKTETTKKGMEVLGHRILLELDTLRDQMPYSIGFHPYFATAGDHFILSHGFYGWESTGLTIDKPFFVPYEQGKMFNIVTSHGTTQIDLVRGYSGFYVWTDRPDLYVCVEPVRVGKTRRYRTLFPNEQVICECKMTYSLKT